MERQKNVLQSVKNEVDILPIEEEFLSSTKRIIENKLGHEIRLCKKYEVHPIYDSYLIAGNDRPFLLKIKAFQPVFLFDYKILVIKVLESSKTKGQA